MDILLETTLKAIEVLSSDEFRESKDVINELINKGFSRLEAEKLFFFIPLAFGREVLKRLEIKEFSDEFVIDTFDNEILTQNLQQQKYFTISSLIAEKTFSDGFLTKEVFQSVLLWSAEFKAVNGAMNEGIDVKDGKILIPTLYSNLKANYWLGKEI